MTPSIISCPLRILLSSDPSTLEPSIFRDQETLAITTRYYSATIPIWRDVLSLTPADSTTWKQEWAASEAAEVVEAIGAWIVLFASPGTKDDVAHLRTVLGTIQSTIELHTQTVDPLLLAVHMKSTILPTLELDSAEWEDICLEEGGWEYVDLRVEKSGEVNEFGEKRGIDRLKEALEANVWGDGGGGGGPTASVEEGEDLEVGGEDHEELGEDEEGMRVNLMGAKEEDGEDDGGGEEDVRALESMMAKLQAVRDSSAELPEQERRKVARKAVEEVMKGF